MSPFSVPAWARALTLLAVSCAATPAAPASSVQPYYDFLHWTSIGEATRAAAQFAPDAVVTTGPHCSAAAPCVGRAAIRERYVLPLMMAHHLLPMREARFDGRHLRAGDSVFAFADGRIASVHAADGAGSGVDG